MVETAYGFFSCKDQGESVFYLFAWHCHCQHGGANDFVGEFRTLKEAVHRACSIVESDHRFAVHVVDKHMEVLFESSNEPEFHLSLDEIRLQ